MVGAARTGLPVRSGSDVAQYALEGIIGFVFVSVIVPFSPNAARCASPTAPISPVAAE